MRRRANKLRLMWLRAMWPVLVICPYYTSRRAMIIIFINNTLHITTSMQQARATSNNTHSHSALNKRAICTIGKMHVSESCQAPSLTRTEDAAKVSSLINQARFARQLHLTHSPHATIYYGCKCYNISRQWLNTYVCRSRVVNQLGISVDHR
jgi:hypothetical protein